MLPILAELYPTSLSQNDSSNADTSLENLNSDKLKDFGLKSIEDVVLFFAKNGTHTDLKFVYCKYPTSPQFYAHPYHLEPVSISAESIIEPPYFIATATGIVGISVDGECDHIGFPRFIQESTHFKVLRLLPFFVQFQRLKAFLALRRLFVKRIKREMTSTRRRNI